MPSKANGLNAVDPSLVYRMFNPQVPVILCAKYSNQIAAMPANSCISVSNSPSLIAVAIKRGSRSNSVVSKSGSFSINWVNYTRKKSENVILKLSRPSPKDPDKLRAFGITYRLVRGVPILHEAQAFATCSVDKIEKTGDHDLFICKVVSARATSDFTRDHYWRFRTYKPALYVGSVREDPVVKFEGL